MDAINVKAQIRRLIHSRMPPEEFVEQVRELVGSKPKKKKSETREEPEATGLNRQEPEPE